MTCASCGCDQMAGAQFCVRCGLRTASAGGQDWASVAPQPLSFTPLAQPRTEQNTNALGLAWCLFGAFRVFTATAYFAGSHAMSWSGHGSHLFWPAVGFSTVFFSALSMLAGTGLLTRQPWARKLAMFLAALALFKFPVGTALGIYTFLAMGSRRARSDRF